jgi:hypothetical protein
MPAFDAQPFIEAVKRCTARLRQLDARRVVFGSSQHKYAFAAPLSEQSVLEYEAWHGVSLPLEYRAFITGIGNGGAGPFYGVLPLPSKPSDLRRPWPYSQRHEVLDEELDLEPPGAITIAEYGCGIFVLLVVKGVHAGEIWWDARHEEAGFDPILARDGTRLRFDTWWLTIMNKHLERFERVRALMNVHTSHDEIHRLLDGSILQLEVDETMASLMNVELSGTPKVIPDKPWGLKCGQVDERYTQWLARGQPIA